MGTVRHKALHRRTPAENVFRIVLRIFCGLVLAYLLMPLVLVVPLSFNGGSFLTLPLEGVSTQWYEALSASPDWLRSLKNSLFVGITSTVLSTTLGTLASFGLKKLERKYARWAYLLMFAPIIIPVIISGVGFYFLYSPLGLVNSTAGLILAHTVLASPFVVVAVNATLAGFDANMMRAGATCGAAPLTVFRQITLPLIFPGVFSGAVFAFAVSFDDVVVALFLAGPEQRTLPVQMFLGVREQINPAIMAAATLLILVAVLLLIVAEALRQRSQRVLGRAKP